MAHLGNWSLDPATWSMSWSAEAYRMFGLVPASTRVAYADYLQRVHEDDRAALDRAIRGSVEARDECDLEHRVYRNNGSIRWMHTIAKPGRGETRANPAVGPARVLGACLDITQRKHDEEALQMSAEQLQALSRRLVDMQELERRRFSRELHDVVGQNLTVLSIKKSAANEVVDAIRVVHRRGRYLSKEFAGGVIDQLAQMNALDNPLGRLSSRERQVLQMLAEGRPVRDIATALSLSPKTVETYRSRMMEKLEIHDFATLVKFAIRHGITPLE